MQLHRVHIREAAPSPPPLPASVPSTSPKNDYRTEAFDVTSSTSSITITYTKPRRILKGQTGRLFLTRIARSSRWQRRWMRWIHMRRSR